MKTGRFRVKIQTYTYQAIDQEVQSCMPCLCIHTYSYDIPTKSEVRAHFASNPTMGEAEGRLYILLSSRKIFRRLLLTIKLKSEKTACIAVLKSLFARHSTPKISLLSARNMPFNSAGNK